MQFVAAMGLMLGALSAHAAMLDVVPAIRQPMAANDTYFQETLVCSVVVKTPLNPQQALPGETPTPLDSLGSLPAQCSGSSVQGIARLPDGIQALVKQGFRLTSVSHQVTPLVTNSKGQVELLISAIFALTRPAVGVTMPVTPASTR